MAAATAPTTGCAAPLPAPPRTKTSPVIYIATSTTKPSAGYGSWNVSMTDKPASPDPAPTPTEQQHANAQQAYKAQNPSHAYVELHLASAFSFLRGASSPEALVARAAALGMRALALTDYMTLAGVVRFQAACAAHAIQPI